MCRQRLGIADIDQACKQLQRILKLRAAGQAAFDTEGQNAGWLAVEIFLRQRVIGMIFKSGIVDPIYLRMLLQILGTAKALAVILSRRRASVSMPCKIRKLLKGESAAPVLRKGTTRARPM